jgi:hypothetical protein
MGTSMKWQSCAECPLLPCFGGGRRAFRSQGVTSITVCGVDEDLACGGTVHAGFAGGDDHLFSRQGARWMVHACHQRWADMVPSKTCGIS